MFFREAGLEKGIVLRMLGVTCFKSPGFCFECIEVQLNNMKVCETCDSGQLLTFKRITCHFML